MKTLPFSSSRFLVATVLFAGAFGCGKFTNPILTKSGISAPQTNGPQTYDVVTPTTTLATLGQFCDVTSFSSTFYSDPGMGIGWGTTGVHSATNPDGANPIPEQMQCCRITRFSRITHIRAHIKTRIDADETTRGYFYITRPFDSAANWTDYLAAMTAPAGAGGFLWSMDAWGRNAWGYNVVTDLTTNTIRVPSTQNTPGNAVIDADYDTPTLELCMSGDTAPAVYAPRHVFQLSVTATP